MRSVCALVDECLGPGLNWNVARFEIRRNVLDVLAATRFPDSGQVRVTIRQSWRRRRKVGLAIWSPRNCGRDFHPLAINRRTNQDQNQYRRQNCKYTSRVRYSFHLTSQFRAIVIDPSGTRQDSLIDESNVST